MSRQRLAELFSGCRKENRAALLPYMTAGLPDPEGSARLFAAMADAGADGFEVGIPYADPLMDGPVIQAAGDRALAAGVRGRGRPRDPRSGCRHYGQAGGCDDVREPGAEDGPGCICRET